MKNITDISQLDLNKSYTYADYLTWRIKERVELIRGKIRKMTAAPSTIHQKALGKLHVSISNSLKDSDCQVFIAPFDVRLPIQIKKGDLSENVVQPDLCVVCDEKKIDEKGCYGAPDLILEVLSPSSSTRDMKDKRKLYEMAGVPEYWVVDPFVGVIHIFLTDENGKYINKYPVTVEDVLVSETINQISVSLDEVFPDILNEPEEGYLPEGVRRL